MLNVRLSILFLLIGSSLSSQSYSPDSLSADIEEITISANRLNVPFSKDSRSISIITSQEIQQTNATNINELLQLVSGLDLRQRGVHGVQADLSIRGGTFEQSLVLIDGVRLSDPQTGHHLMNLPLDIQDIERVEVVKGPAARVFGQKAFAGAVNIITKMPEKLGASLGLEYGENNMRNIYAQVVAPIGKYQQKISASYRAADSLRFNTDYKIANMLYQSRVPLGNSMFNFKAGHVDRDFGANGFYGNESFADQYETVQTSFASAELKSQYKSLTLMPRISYRRNKDNWQFRREDPEFFQNFHTTEVVTIELHNSWQHNLGTFGFGVDYNYQYLDSSNLKDSTGLGIHERNLVGLHLENRFLLADGKIDFTPGLMLLAVSDFDLTYYPGIDLGYALTEQIKAFANVGWTTRIPTYTDLYYQDRGNEGNPDLVEEDAFTYELGLKYNRSRLSSSLSFFSRSATNQIDWYRATEDDKWRPDNFSKANYRGVDLSFKQAFAKGLFIQNLTLGYTFLDATFEETDFIFSRNELENLRHQLVFNSQFGIGAVSLNLVFKYNDRVSLEDYFTLNGNLSYKYKGHRIFLRATNIFDKVYRETNLVEMPGRWLSGGIRVKF